MEPVAIGSSRLAATSDFNHLAKCTRSKQDHIMQSVSDGHRIRRRSAARDRATEPTNNRAHPDLSRIAHQKLGHPHVAPLPAARATGGDHPVAEATKGPLQDVRAADAVPDVVAHGETIAEVERKWNLASHLRQTGFCTLRQR